MESKFTYAGIGSRQIPEYAISMIRKVAIRLAELGGHLRSGGAVGADSAFAAGAIEAHGSYIEYLAADATPEALVMAEQFHPAWDRCSYFARQLHARNCFQILGKTLDDPVEFVVCWRSPAAKFSGTDQALRIARHHGIPIFNLADSRENGWDRLAAHARSRNCWYDC